MASNNFFFVPSLFSKYTRSILFLSLSLFNYYYYFFFFGGGGEVGGSTCKSNISHGQSSQEEFNKANNICYLIPYPFPPVKEVQ